MNGDDLQDLGDYIVSSLPGAATQAVVSFGELTILAEAKEIVRVVTFLHDADPEQLADLLAELVGAGFRVVEFGGRGKTLEEAFLHVTRGVVQ